MFQKFNSLLVYQINVILSPQEIQMIVLVMVNTEDAL